MNKVYTITTLIHLSIVSGCFRVTMVIVTETIWSAKTKIHTI